MTETVAGKSTLLADHPNFAGPIGVTGSTSANLLAADADVVLAIGTRLQDFTTGSWSVFRNENMNSSPSTPPGSMPTSIGPSRSWATPGSASKPIDAGLGEYVAPPEWLARTAEVRGDWYSYLDEISAPEGKPTYAKVIRAINEVCDPTDYLVSAAGGLPGELNTGWHSKSVHSFDSEYGYSTMGYEIAGAWGAKMALPDRDVICWTGDGSYLMMNSDIYSTVMTGHKVIFIVCDNGGFAVINRLQVNTGGEEFNNLLRSSPPAAADQGGLRQTRRGHGRHRHQGRDDRRSQGGICRRQEGRSQQRHRHRGRRVLLDRRRGVVGSGSPRSFRSRAGAGWPGPSSRRSESINGSGYEPGVVARAARRT